ncbi:MAG: VWA domain-containing protein [Acidobacteria bacterium]|nr:MAG: VWA domain-containing protein [Acidobacteriota bacterium]REJ98677.1 MAG: VWA domain-containing protein [Acidobacteriota bacterium]REK16667.1 MAG: VWA domain-containing protein [Acidobacteriota bacterium]REK42578.1 MAG: VWA domain-containing protein [Acidobacteriota bacterium]
MIGRICESFVDRFLDLTVFFARVALLVSVVTAQTGVLIPSSTSDVPDPSVLSLDKMTVDIEIEDQHATVRVLQIFENHTSSTLEGKYLFALPTAASVADFAVWDGVQRVPGVMMEKRRANRIYEEIKAQAIDPGLLQQDDEHGGSSAFSAKVFPITPYGTKRLEMEYTEVLPVEDLRSVFTFPLRPSYGESQSVRDLQIRLRISNTHLFALTSSKEYPFKTVRSSANEYVGEFKGSNVTLVSDLSLSYELKIDTAKLAFLAHRSDQSISAYDLKDPRSAEKSRDGFFRAEAIFPRAGNIGPAPPLNLLLMFDTSLSMYGDKLRRSVEGIEHLVGSLREQDRFNLILFDDTVRVLADAPVRGSPGNREKALAFVRRSALGGGTNLRAALASAAAESSKFGKGGSPRVIIISDANPTTETVNLPSISSAFDSSKARFFAFGIGSDTNVPLLRDVARKTNGYYTQVRETQDISVELDLFLKRVVSPAIENLSFSSSDDSNLYEIYATNDTAASGSSYGFVGRYKRPGTQKVRLNATVSSIATELSKLAALPDRETANAFIARIWAKARINALIDVMNVSGEREDLISEIISLSEKYKIVTPYTAFIAAPRALLRPRLIQPGDPVIRVRTDKAISEVFAVLPYGETLPLRYVDSEDVWQTRFLAPVWMQDGTYFCRLILKDKNGNVYEEKKSFVIDSKSPKIRLILPKTTLRAGETVKLKVLADKDTNRLTARIYGSQAAHLRWASEEKANVGELRIPSDLTPGRYVITVTAEDFAHNQTIEEYEVSVTRGAR